MGMQRPGIGEDWDELSAEQGSKYLSDVLFSTTRAGAFPVADLWAYPTDGELPAIEAGQR
jgi:hypothetical protein